MEYELKTLEDAVLAALEPLRSAGLRTLEPFQGLDDADDLVKLAKRFPAIWVSGQLLTYDYRGQWDALTAEIVLIVGDKHQRGAAEAARGDSGGGGVYLWLSESRELLHRRVAPAGWEALVIISDEPILADPGRGVALWAAKYQTLKPT